MTKCFFACLVLTLFLLPCPSHSQSLVEDLGIEVKGVSREFSFTNKETAFYYGETNADNRSGWQGFNVFGHEFLDDYEIWVDEKKLDRKSARSVVYPDYLKRIYANGVVEEFRMADSLSIFSITVSSPESVHVDIIPYFSDGSTSDQFEMKLSPEGALIARKNHLSKTEKENYPVWLAVSGEGFLPQLKDRKQKTQFSPLMMVGRKAPAHTIVFCVGETQEATKANAENYLLHKGEYHRARRTRMETLLRETFVQTDNQRFDKALAWAKLSLDALTMNQVTKGIFAGLPWFNNYWGRDTFISLPGATLVQGRFTEAKHILKSFTAYQQTDSTSTDYGRIPNIVTTTEKAYNTADGTPRFVMMAKEYVERSGDTTFVSEMYPTIRRSIEGTLRYHCDSLGFLTHGDAETWMDAVGPDGPWSARGNRANDIQALWAQQLEAGVWFALRLGDVKSNRSWSQQLETLKKNFTRHFIRNGRVVDHLNKDGSADKQLRPNQIFTSSLLDEGTRASVLRSVVNDLTYHYGVASLSQNDDNFHPYHQHDRYYPKDAAYHNGTVWTWVQGAVISELCNAGTQELAAQVTENSVHQILDRGAVGTQSELIDAIARPGEREPRLSGTFSQAWNLGEFIRNFYDDYLGIRVDLLHHHLVLRPSLPRSFGNVKATINLNGRSLPIEIERTERTTTVQINGANLRKGGTAEVILPLPKGDRSSTSFRLPAQSVARLSMRNTSSTLLIDGISENTLTTQYFKNSRPKGGFMRLAEPKLRGQLQSMQGPAYPLLSHRTIKSTSTSGRIICDELDPANDDKGTGAFTYPLNALLKNGSLDLLGFKVFADKQNAYFNLKFRALSNPGWHPEYGFQLTYIAIAVDEDGIKNSGKRLVGQNANFLLTEEYAYEKLLLVGGGVRLEDKNGNILAAYIPTEADVANPLGDADAGTISFAIPLSYLGVPSKSWRFTVLVGAQDDHGGAGIGEFRSVKKEAGEWHGGGKKSADDPNVYDVLLVKGK